jgi:lysozyme family protein
VLLAELAKRDPRAVINAINDERLRFMRSLKIYPTYAHGWTTRVAEVRAYSLQLASDTAPSLPVPKPEVQTAAKAQVTPPAGLKKAIAAGGAIATSSPTTQPDWVAAHPGELALIVGAGVVITGAALWGVHAWHKLQQEAATAGLVPVPVAA